MLRFGFKIYIYRYRFLLSTIVHFLLFLIFTLFQPFSIPYLFIPPLLLQPFFLPYIFISPLPFTLIPFFIFLFIFLHFCLFLFTPSYYKFVTISSILSIVFPHKKRFFSLSLSLSIVWWIFFPCITDLG